MIVLLILILVILAILLLPVGAWVVFSGEGLTLYVEIGPLKIKVYPGKSQLSGKETPKKQKKRKPKEQKKKTGEKPEEKAPAEKATLGAQLPFFRELLSRALSALGCLKRKLILRKLTLYLCVGCKGEDPAAAGLLYGKAWAVAGALTPVLENSFRIRKRDIQVFCNFLEEKTTVYAEGRIMFHVGDMLFIGLRHGVPILIALIQNKRKGGKKNGTSDK